MNCPVCGVTFEVCPKCQTPTAHRFSHFVIWCEKCDKSYVSSDGERKHPLPGELEGCVQ